MNIADFRERIETLGRFAQVRDKAPEPEDRVLVQAVNGRLKLVAGTDSSVVVIDLGETPEKGRVVVSSRLLLTAGKSLRGKGDVALKVFRGGAMLGTSIGGKVKLPAISTELPEFLRPAKDTALLACHDGLAAASKLLDAPVEVLTRRAYLAVDESGLLIRVPGNTMLVDWMLPRQKGVALGFVGTVDAKFWSRLRGLDAPGELRQFPAEGGTHTGAFSNDRWTTPEGGDRGVEIVLPGTPGQLVAVSGPYTAATRLERNPDWMHPHPGYPNVSDRVELPVKGLATALKAVAPNDEHARVRLVPQAGSVDIEAWGGAGAMAVEADFAHHGSQVGFNAALMTKFLAALPGKTAVIEWESGRSAPIRLSSKEAPQWQLLLAPVI